MTSAPVDPGEAGRSLVVVCDALDRSEIEATTAERAYLAGARDALLRLAGAPPEDAPTTGHT